jgi:hypothetical protein
MASQAMENVEGNVMEKYAGDFIFDEYNID